MHLGNRLTSPTRPTTLDNPPNRHFSLKPMWMQKLLNHSIFVRDESRCQSPEALADGIDDHSAWQSFSSESQAKCMPLCEDIQRPVTGLPRQATFKRQNSERRERLCPVEPSTCERRTASATRHASTSCVRRRRTRSSPPPMNECRASAPAVASISPIPVDAEREQTDFVTETAENDPLSHEIQDDNVFDYEERPSRPLSRASSSWPEHSRAFQADLDTKWILNLSMHFRDKSDREKFFITYAETPTRWRRVTVSCDYRHAETGSLEIDLKELQFQRDKNLAIYEAIYESLPDIQFYETVTNLKLETTDGRLHVHVTEDVNEIIPYPSREMVRHICNDPDREIRPLELCERDIVFEAHLSGFVYRVSYQGKVYIKKEIPSPDTIDEFLYEINALHALSHSDNVIKLEAIILDDSRQVVKGLLISFAERGAVVDILYDHKGQIPWATREQWALQAVIGLRDIHEEGYVQGDFTLSNIVVDGNNDAKIIDINRRGCPVGWEPPEIAQKIASSQRISMYIGEKSDIYQLGMTLWALAMDDDEPERHDPPLNTGVFTSEVPVWYRQIVDICLSEQPRNRLSAKELVNLFPTPSESPSHEVQDFDVSPRPHSVPRAESKQYIDPNAAVERDDLERFKHEEVLLYSPQSSKDDYTFTYPRSSEYDHDSCASTFDRGRGRSAAPKAHDDVNMSTENIPEHRSHEEIQMGQERAGIPHAGPKGDNPYDKVDTHDRTCPARVDSFSPTERGTLGTSTPSATGPQTFLSPTLLAKSPSPFRLPNWRRSLSESTPRNSRFLIPSQVEESSPEISTCSTFVDLRDLAGSAGLEPSERSSAETIAGCDISVGDTSSSSNTAFSQERAESANYEPMKCEMNPFKVDEVSLLSVLGTPIDGSENHIGTNDIPV